MTKPRISVGVGIDIREGTYAAPVSSRERTVYESRGYAVASVSDAKRLAEAVLTTWLGDGNLPALGLPEVDDRYHIWRVPLVLADATRLGELVFDARTRAFDEVRSTRAEVLRARMSKATARSEANSRPAPLPSLSALPSTVIHGDARHVLSGLPGGSVNLVFTSPPYFNARPDYSEYEAYDHYLHMMRDVIRGCHRLLAEGRFFVINVAPVLVRRTKRSEASQRIAVPFDLHQIFKDEGFDFIDDIIWVKPEGAGWATGRGRRFAADRNPLQYKAVPVTEYVLVYRKHSDHLIDWNIRKHPDQGAVASSRIEDGYERTNVWRISPTSSKLHPAVFPAELAERVIRYYSFQGDVVLDPFAGIGTVGEVASRLGRRYVLVEIEGRFVEIIMKSAAQWSTRGEQPPLSLQ